MIRRLAFALLLAAAACGGSKPGSGGGGETIPSGKLEGSAAAVVELGEMSIYEGEDVIAKIHIDGKTEVAGGEDGKQFQPGFTIALDGTIKLDGTALAKINADGTITDVRNNQKLPVTLTSDKVTISDGDKTFGIELSPTGVVSIIGDEAPKKEARIEGANTPGQRKTALAFIALMAGMRSGGSPPPEEAGSGAPATPVAPTK